jgi:hypothetical protein
MCRVSAYQEPFFERLSCASFTAAGRTRRQVETRLDELERDGWSLPVYRCMIPEHVRWGYGRIEKPHLFNAPALRIDGASSAVLLWVFAA